MKRLIPMCFAAAVALAAPVMAFDTIVRLPVAQVANASEGLPYWDGGVGAGPFRHITVNWSAANANVGLLQFDVSAYPGAGVNGATLNIFHEMNQVQGALFGVFRNTSPWIGVTTGWDTRPAFDPSPAATLLVADSSTAIFRKFDVTSLVEGWIGGDYANYGVTLMRIDSPNPYAYFAGTGAERDANIVMSLSPVPEPAAFALLLGGLALLGAATRRRGR